MSARAFPYNAPHRSAWPLNISCPPGNGAGGRGRGPGRGRRHPPTASFVRSNFLAAGRGSGAGRVMAATARITGPNGGSRTRPAGGCPTLCLCCLFRTFQGAINRVENLCVAIVRGVKTFSNVNGVLEPERLNRPSGVSSTFVHGRLSLS